MQHMRPDPLFIVYKRRSGSTFLADLLSKHPAIGLAPESRFVLNLMQWDDGRGRQVTEASLEEVLDVLYQEPKFRTWKLSREELRTHVSGRLPLSTAEFARCVMRRYCRKHHPGCVVWGLKKGEYLYNVAELRSLFPQAQFVHILRDGRAVFASSKRARHSETGEPFETKAGRSATAWINVVRVFERAHDEQYAYEVQYEELMRTPAPSLKRLLYFLSVEAGDETVASMLHPHETDYVPESQSHLFDNVGDAPDPSRIHGWKEELPEEEVRTFESIAKETLERKGYETLHSYGSARLLYGRWIRAKNEARWAAREVRKTVRLRTRIKRLYERMIG